MKSSPLSRRQLLSSAALLGIRSPLALSLAGLGSLAQAASTGGYKALVCLYLHGGSDMHNWLVPADAAALATYRAQRGALAWPAERLALLGASGQQGGRSFAMPVELDPLRRLYQAGRLGFLTNVGPLERPTSKADYQRGVGLPSKLFSHNDQTSAWQSLQPEGAPSGWGGRMADILMSANSRPVFTALSSSGNAVFLAGRRAVQYQVSGEGPVAVRAANSNWVFGSNRLGPMLADTLSTAPGGDAFAAELATVQRRSLETSKALQDALAQVSLAALPSTPVTLGASGAINLSTDGLARQLHLTARLMAAGQRMGMSRQIFMVGMGGFDTHSNQMRDQPAQMARIALATEWFQTALQGLGLQDSATLFSAAEFGRTLVSNGDGSDHGWGSHHFVAGPALRGGEIHGRFPDLAKGSADEVGSGRLLPSTGVVQLAAQLGGWMGLTPGELADVLPTLKNFG